MKNRRLIPALMIALVISGLCTYLLSRKMSIKSAASVPEQKYVALKQSLQAGELIKADNVEFVGWPAANPIAGAFVKSEELVGRAVLYPMDKGQPITDRFLSTIGAGAGLAGKIPDGMRAIALRSDEIVGVAGFLLPGSHLDVLATFQTRALEPTTLTVLQDAEVLAAGHQIQPDPEGKPAVVTVVTLLLTPLDAERAVLASSQGTIHFVLRSGLDKSKTQDTPVLLSQLLGSSPSTLPKSSSVTPALHTVSHSVSAPYVVETINGDKQTTDSFSTVGK